MVSTCMQAAPSGSSVHVADANVVATPLFGRRGRVVELEAVHAVPGSEPGVVVVCVLIWEVRMMR